MDDLLPNEVVDQWDKDSPVPLALVPSVHLHQQKFGISGTARSESCLLGVVQGCPKTADTAI